MTSPPPPPNSSTTAGATPFVFPREYFFPPFFTRQTNLTTHHAQLVKWSALVLSYCRHHRIFKLSISSSGIYSSNNTRQQPHPGLLVGDQQSDPPSPVTNDAPLELFHNRKINRQLSLADIREIIDFLRKDGRAEYIHKSDLSSNGFDYSSGADPKTGTGTGDVVWIFWRTPEEWASLIEAWVDETGQKGSVLTLYELTSGEGTRGTGR